jgi:hypothetical protein
MSKFITLNILLLLDIIWFLCFPKPILLPLHSTLPDQEIISKANDSISHSIDFINFIDTNGSNYESRSLLTPSPIWFYDFPIKAYLRRLGGSMYAWSLDGNSIGMTSPAWVVPTQGYPIIVDKNGKTHFCPERKSILVQGNILVISPTEVMAIENILESDGERLVTYDMEHCKISAINYLPKDYESLERFSYTNTHWLAIEIGSTRAWDSKYNDFAGIRVFDPEMNVILEIPNANSPALTPNGKRIAFIMSDEVCVSDISNFKPVCTGEANLKLSWSPDGKWIVYSNFHNEIIKQDVATGEETIIAKGIFPDWRP